MNALCSGADPQLNDTPATEAAIDGDAAVLTVGETLNIGTRARMVVLTAGLALEVKNGAGDWVRQSAWEEAG